MKLIMKNNTKTYNIFNSNNELETRIEEELSNFNHL